MKVGTIMTAIIVSSFLEEDLGNENKRSYRSSSLYAHTFGLIVAEETHLRTKHIFWSPRVPRMCSVVCEHDQRRECLTGSGEAAERGSRYKSKLKKRFIYI